MKRVIVVSILLIAAAVWTTGCAQKGGFHGHAMPDPKSYNAHFGDMDTDGNETVSWEEFKAYFPQADPKVFEAVDLNKDGGIDHDEWHEFKEAHGLGHIE